MRNILSILTFFGLTLTTFAQQIVVQAGDTVYLDITSYRGNLQWQISHDKTTWTDLPGRTFDTIKYVPQQFPAFFRVKIVEGTCEPHYSDMVEAVVPSVPKLTTLVSKSIGPRSAQVTGDIYSTGGFAVTARGIVYSLTPNPDLNDSYTVAGTGGGEFESYLINLLPNTTYYARAYATNAQGTAYGNEVSFTTPAEKTYVIGETGPAGGIVFYDKGSYSNGWRYLEFAPAKWYNNGNDPWNRMEWGCYQKAIGGTSTAIGTGLENTMKILDGCDEAGIMARMAVDAVINGYTDWFLPSRDELSVLYSNMEKYQGSQDFRNKHGFLLFTYTSSSEIDAKSAWGVGFNSGTFIQHLKTSVTMSLRPVRRF